MFSDRNAYIVLSALNYVNTFDAQQLNSKGQPQERAMVVTDSHIFKLDPSKGYQKNRAPLALSQVVTTQ